MEHRSATARLDQLLSRCGYASRREVAQWIHAGRITLEGEEKIEPARRVRPETVRVDGEPLDAPEGLLVMLNKPAGLVCSRDPREGPNVYDLLPERWSRRHPPITSVGRLDKDTTGLLLLTDIGEWVHRWTSPRHHVEKTYEVTVDADLAPNLVDLFASGTLRLDHEESPCLPARLEILSPRESLVHLTEGRYHQVRRMFAAVGCRVVKLHRSRIGTLLMGDLPEGTWRRLPLSLGAVEAEREEVNIQARVA